MGMGYTLHQKFVKEQEKNSKMNNLCITSLKNYEKGEKKYMEKKNQKE